MILSKYHMGFSVQFRPHKKYLCFQLPTVPKVKSPTLIFLLSFLFFYN